MSPKFIDKEEKRKQIGMLALSYFAKEGTVTGSISQIARAVGVGKGTIYEYFRSKEELITYAMELYVEDTDKHINSLLEGVVDPKERLRQYSVSIVRHIIENPTTTGILLAIFQLLVANAGKKRETVLLENMFRQVRFRIIDIIKDGAKQGVFNQEAGKQAESLAINLIAFLDGLWMHFLVSGDFDLKVQANHYLDLLYAAIDAD